MSKIRKFSLLLLCSFSCYCLAEDIPPPPTDNQFRKAYAAELEKSKPWLQKDIKHDDQVKKIEIYSLHPPHLQPLVAVRMGNSTALASDTHSGKAVKSWVWDLAPGHTAIFVETKDVDCNFGCRHFTEIFEVFPKLIYRGGVQTGYDNKKSCKADKVPCVAWTGELKLQASDMKNSFRDVQVRKKGTALKLGEYDAIEGVENAKLSIYKIRRPIGTSNEYECVGSCE